MTISEFVRVSLREDLGELILAGPLDDGRRHLCGDFRSEIPDRAYPSASGGSISCGGDCGSVLRTNIEHMFARLV